MANWPRNYPGTMVRPEGWPESASRPVVTPLQPSVVYAAESPDALDDQYEGRTEGYAYAREGHPNATVLAGRISAMEGLEHGIVMSSGMAAVSAALLGILKAGDHIIGGDQLYGRSLRLMTQDLPRLGIATTLTDAGSIEAVAGAITPRTRMILIEVVSNPTLRVADLKGIAALARERGILLAVDNTFTTPLALKPIEYGADIVIHSVTKLMAGHSDATLGYVGANDPALMTAMNDFAVTTGMTASPFDCWLAERGLLSFELRFERASATAAALADRLSGLPGMKRVIYPGRDDHPDRARAVDLLGDKPCNMVSFEIDGGRAAANALVRACEGVSFAPTLGDVGTTLSHPPSSSHRALTPEDRAALGISEGFFRVSVGLEDPDALCDSFEKAVRAAAKA